MTEAKREACGVDMTGRYVIGRGCCGQPKGHIGPCDDSHEPACAVPAKPEQTGKAELFALADKWLKHADAIRSDEGVTAAAEELEDCANELLSLAEAGKAQAGKAEQKAYEQLVADALTLARGVTSPGTIGAHHLVEASSRIHAAHGKFRPFPPSPPTSKEEA
jgi:hypothetical protein